MYIKALKNIAGVVLISIGIIGLFLPILQGILLIIAGLALMGIKLKDVRKWIKKIRL